MSSLKQQAYRRLMKAQKSSSGQKKVDHPLARYNSLGQLSCTVCGVQVKSELLWSTHLQSRKHKETVSALKRKALSNSGGQDKKEDDVPAAPTTLKRKHPEDAETAPSAKKSISPTEDSTGSSQGLPSDFFDQRVRLPSTEDENGDGEGERETSSSSAVTSTNLPTDLVDKGKPQSTKEEPPSEKGNMIGPKESLPEGFFDDPKMDAKARKVEYKDPMVEQWEKFKKSIQKEDEVSEALLVEGDEETMEDRELTEVNEQVACFTRAELLRQKQEKLMAKRQDDLSQLNAGAKEEEMERLDSPDNEELDFDEFLDWRAKIS